MIGKFTPCHDKRCLLCQYSSSTETFQSSVTGETFKIFGQLSCKSANVIYLITCSVCQQQYVGETKNALNIRINLHRNHIKTKDQYQATAIHFNTKDHDWTNMQVVTIDQNNSWNEAQRKSKERWWIEKLKPNLNIR